MAYRLPFALGRSNGTPVTSFDFTLDDPWESLRDLAQEMKEIKENGLYTPDYPLLCKKKTHYVFVYGTLKKSFRNHDYLGKDAKLVGTAMTQADRYYLAVNNKHAYPVAFFDNRIEHRAKLYGEVYEVDPKTIKLLDYLESNTLMYKRYPLLFDVFQKDGTKQDVRAWVYLGIKDYWSERIQYLNEGKLFKPNNKADPYYMFTLPEQD